MKLHCFKAVASTLFAFLLFGGMAGVVVASAPHVIVRVEDQDGVPLSGVKVKWTDIYNSTIYADTTGSSYQIQDELGGNVTIKTGEALFRSWDLPPERGGFPNQSLLGSQIDHDFDPSTPTVPSWEVKENGQLGRFGCGQNPHSFTAFTPKEMGLVCNTTGGELKNQELTNTFKITCQKVAPACPTDIKLESCDIPNQTMTVSWQPPEGGADGYKLYFDREIFDDLGAGDFLLPDRSNNLRRTVAISLNYPYRVRIRSLKNVNGQTAESPTCWKDFICQGGTPPSPCPSGDCPENQKPTATLTGALCPNRPGPFYYEYTLSNIQTYGLPFLNSRLMITFLHNSQTKQILDFLNNSSDVIPYEKGFSRWRELNRQKMDGDYFGFYVNTYTALPTEPFILNDSTVVGTTTIGALRQFLEDQNLPTIFDFKANMTTRIGVLGEIFNSHIPAGKIDISLTQNTVCAGTECTEATACLDDIVITNPGDEIVVPVKNGNTETITVTWTSSAAPGSQYEVILYDTAAHSSAQAAFDDREAAIAANTPIPSVQYFTTTNKSQSFDINDMGKTLAVGVRGYLTTCLVDGSTVLSCDWTEKEIKLGFTVSGNFYLDNQCISTSTSVDLSGQISGSNTTEPLDNQNNYSLILPYTTTGHDLTLEIGTDDYICATANLQCPALVSSNTCRIPNVTGPATDKHFYVQTALAQYQSWWQVRGGLVYGNNAITSRLPFDLDGNTLCTEPDCKPFLVRREYLNLAEKSAGVPMTTGIFSTEINGWWTDRAGGNRAHSEGTNNVLTGESREDFAFFYDLITEDVSAQPSPGTVSDVTGGTTLSDGTQVWLFTGDLTIKPNSTWNVGNKRVILVQGSIRFESDGPGKLTAVSPGGFLAFFATGNITFDNEVGADVAIVNDTDPNVEGIFIADQQLIVEGNGAGGDKKFIGAGTFVGWQNVSLQRRFNNPNDDTDTVNLLKNTNMPVESFFFRPDFVINTPEFMKNATYTWKEVN